jgi:uncharacterized membrane protein
MLVLVGAGIVAYEALGGTGARAENAPPAPTVSNVPPVVERPLTEAVATKNHPPFPLVTVDEAGEVRFAVAEFGDGAAHFFTVMMGDCPVEFFVLRSADGAIRAAFNACDVCYREKLGYTQDGQVMVCNNCGNRFLADRINVVRGGCNPAPLDRSIDGEELVITAESLVGGLAYFL